jgi:Zn-dependent M16 (insulinase) family peptidase
MKTTKTILSFLFLIVLVHSSARFHTYEIGDVYSGFKLLDKKFVKEVNAECLYFDHVKSGARLFKIAAEDANKFFSIAFKTDPETNCGTPHIMEHSVLNGSKNFPVKSPYDELRKGSLSTFMNAFTGDDLTCYPIASMNEKDYFNLMHVYLDAVFNPRIYDDPRILKQEGWHYEMENVEGQLTYKGVVYNEMKGAFSDPSTELGYQINKNLFPDNGYHYSSGGYPSAIPKLTYSAFLDYHRKYYHPVNSYILLYGDADLDKELSFIDKEYLSKYSRSDRPVTFPLQKSFTAMKDVTAQYPVTEGSIIDNQTYISLSFVAGLNTDRALVMALKTISDVLINQESAPVRLALQDAGIGKDVNASVDELQQNVIHIIVQNANSSDKNRFHDIVMKTLRHVVEKGIDKKAVEGSINRTEFLLREGNTPQKGLTYNFQILPGWFFADDPYLTLEYEKPLANVKTALKTNYLESIIQKYIIDNPHALLLKMEPEPGLEKENNARSEKELKDYESTLSLRDKELLVKQTEELIAYQKEDNPQEALATIPVLDLKDVNPDATWYKIEEKKVSNVPVLYYKDFTNSIVYARFLFDVRVLPQDLISYAALLTEVLGNQNTENYSFGDLDKELNINTGGFNAFLIDYFENQDDKTFMPKIVINSKAMNGKLDKLFELTDEIVNHTRLTDVDRLKTIIARLQSQLDEQVKQNGYGYAQGRLISYFDNSGVFDELTNGFDYYWFITNLANNFDEMQNEITNNLTKTAALLFTKENLIATVTCGEDDYKTYSDNLQNFITTLPDSKAFYQKWEFNPEIKNEGFLTSSKVQYVIEGYNFKKLGYNWSGKMLVLNRILSRDYLHTRIRVVGGAYGGFSIFNQNGLVLFNSYRDPNLKETLDNYNGIINYIGELSFSPEEVTKYIIGTISSIDNPYTPSQKGNIAVKNYLEKTSKEDVQSERDEILSTTLSDIKEMKKMMADVLSKNAFCVYGNEEKIQLQKDLFGKTETLSR